MGFVIDRWPALLRWGWYWGPVCVYAGVIFYLSSLSLPHEALASLLEEVSDKVLHMVEYGLLAALCYRAFRWSAGPAAARFAALLAIVASSSYGLTDEIHQAFVPLRESSWQDWIADTAGALVGATVYGAVESRGSGNQLKGVGGSLHSKRQLGEG